MNTTEEEFSQGLVAVVAPAIQKIDQHVQSLRGTQITLKDHIDNLNKDLDQISEVQKDLPNLDNYVRIEKLLFLFNFCQQIFQIRYVSSKKYQKTKFCKFVIKTDFYR